MGGQKPLASVRPTPIRPDDFGLKLRRAEDLIQYKTRNMNGVAITVEEKRSGGRENAMQFEETFVKKTGVLLV